MRFNTKTLTLCAAALLTAALAAPLSAEAAPDSITVDQAVKAALATNLQVRSAEVEARIKKRASDLSWNKFLPSLSLSGTYAHLNNPSKYFAGLDTKTFAPIMGQIDANNLMLGFNVQEVFSATFFALMDQAAIEYQKSLITQAQARKSMTATVKKIFYQLLVQEEAIALTRARLDSAKERFRQAEIIYKLGQSSELNYQYARMSVENLTPDLRALESGRAAALTQFQQVLGYDSRPDMRLAGSLDDEAPGEAPAPGGAAAPGSEYDRFEVLQAKQGERQIESGLQAQRYALLPNLVIGYKADPTLNGPKGKDLFDKDNWNQNSGAISVTLAWSLDALLPASNIRLGKAELQDRLAFAREAEAMALRAARDDAVNQARAVQDSLDRIANLTNVADAAKRAYELTNAAYQLGTGRILDLQDAEVAWQGARMQLLSERLKLAALGFDFEAKYSGEAQAPAAVK